MKKKKIVTALPILLICLTLGACKDKGLKEPDWDENTLVYAHVLPSNNYRDLLDGFQKAHPGLQIEVRDYTDEGGMDMPQGSTITDYYATKSMMFRCIFAMSLDGYVDWEAGKCSFDSDGFRNALEFVDCFPDEFDWSPDNGGLEELRSRRRDGLEMLSMIPINDPAYISYLENFQYGGKASFVGYPVGDDSVGSGFVPSTSICHVIYLPPERGRLGYPPHDAAA